MTKSHDDIRELTIDETDKASGGAQVQIGSVNTSLSTADGGLSLPLAGLVQAVVVGIRAAAARAAGLAADRGAA